MKAIYFAQLTEEEARMHISTKSHVIRRYLRRSTRFGKQLLHQDSRSPIGKGIICDRYIWGARGSANKIEKSIKIVIQGIGIGNQITIKRPVVKGNLSKGDEQLGSPLRPMKIRAEESVHCLVQETIQKSPAPDGTAEINSKKCLISTLKEPRNSSISTQFRKQLLNQHPRSPIGKGIICDRYIRGAKGSVNKIEKSIKIVIQGIGIGNQITIKRPVVKGNLSKGDEQLGSPLRPMKIRAEESAHCLVRETIQKIPAPDGTAEINSKKSGGGVGWGWLGFKWRKWFLDFKSMISRRTGCLSSQNHTPKVEENSKKLPGIRSEKFGKCSSFQLPKAALF
ncbi:hypothetical protein CDAR_79411 [Caerostris darwini]|uniref:Uncharacterized protein n=1 Tax=Caerostris darwini TaxID=1538125 RepID=A0AAV4RM15_9ARAC|nr:hypothetical protein CDAR_79411 [Caerostris darwini]